MVLNPFLLKTKGFKMQTKAEGLCGFFLFLLVSFTNFSQRNFPKEVLEMANVQRDLAMFGLAM